MTWSSTGTPVGSTFTQWARDQPTTDLDKDELCMIAYGEECYIERCVKTWPFVCQF